MRCDQLAQFVAQYSEGVNVEVMPLIPPERRAGHWRRILRRASKGAVIVLKGATEVLTDEQGQELRSLARVFAIDHVDLQVKRIAAPRADIHIACSAASLTRWREAVALYAEKRGIAPPSQVVLVDHHADPTLSPLAASALDRLRVVYMGKAQNAELPGRVAERVEIFSANTGAEFSAAIGAVQSAQVHYNVRPVPESNLAKPFTKGFTAAAMDRAILTTPDVEDATRFLGEDYPLFARSRSEDDILAAMDQGAAAIGTPRWDDIMDRMRSMRDAVHPRAVAGQLTDALDPYLA